MWKSLTWTLPLSIFRNFTVLTAVEESMILGGRKMRRTGRIRPSVTVGATAVEICPLNPRRRRLIVSIGHVGATLFDLCSVMLVDGNDRVPTTTFGFPLTSAAGPLVIEGLLATHRFSAIRLNGVDAQLGVIEEFDEELDGDDVGFVAPVES